MAILKNSLWFVSDVHIESSAPQRTSLFETFLRDLVHLRLENASSITHFFMLGDIFDLWVGGGNFFYRKYQSVVDPILELIHLGVKVFYIEGNHDVHVSAFWQEKGVVVSRNALEIEFSQTAESYIEIHLTKWHPQTELVDVAESVSSKPWGENLKKARPDKFILRVEHGDYINPLDRGYLKYVEVIRKDSMRFLAAAIPARVWSFLGEKASQISRRKSRAPKDFEQRKIRLIRWHRQFAHARFSERPYDLLVTGHTHSPDQVILPSGALAVNLGSWLEPKPQALCVQMNLAYETKICFKQVERIFS